MWGWSKKDRAGIARFVIPSAVNRLALNGDRLELLRQGGRLAVIEAIYNSLCTAAIKYAGEPYDPRDVIQPIRTPEELLGAPHEGTCLDLALLFCGLCLGNELIPILVVTEGHAFVAVSLNYDLKEWKSIARDELTPFSELITDPELLTNLINQGSYLVVECTGFAKSTILSSSVPEGIGRDQNGQLSFERAREAGVEQFSVSIRPFTYAIDIAIAQYDWYFQPNDKPGEFNLEAYEIQKEYLNGFIDVVNKEFPDPTSYFSSTFTIGEEVVPVDYLVDEAKKTKRLILRGYAGGGKSLNLKKIIAGVLQNSYIPILINLKRWRLEYSEELNKAFFDKLAIEEKIDILFKASVTDLNLRIVDSFGTDTNIFMMVDGLNEVDGKETRSNILACLYEYVREKAPFFYAIVTDRIAEGDSQPKDWAKAVLNPLDADQVRSLIESRINGASYDELSEKSRELLRIPYFLDYALRSRNPRLESAAKAIEEFFIDSFFYKNDTVDEEGLNELARAAFDAYLIFKSTSFVAEEFQGRIEADLWTRLVDSGVIRVTGDQASFDHQLKHDYLASRHLARDESLWDAKSFDAVTLEAKNLELLLMTLEQLDGEARGDTFGRKLYDWNWLAAVMFFTEAARIREDVCSREMLYAVLAVVAEKLFDPVKPTRRRAQKQLAAFRSELGKQFAQTQNLNEIIDLITGFESNVDWFLEWRKLFTHRPSGLNISEDEIRLISSLDAMLGWTAANVIRRFKRAEGDIRQLRGIYDALDDNHEKDDRHRDAVQWRVVHALGVFDSEENVKLLFRALLGTVYHWAKYGAARSLVEIAAVTSNNSLRDDILKQLGERIKELDSKVVIEIFQTALYRDAIDGWTETIKPFLEQVKQTIELGEKDKEVIKDIIGEFNADTWNK